MPTPDARSSQKTGRTYSQIPRQVGIARKSGHDREEGEEENFDREKNLTRHVMHACPLGRHLGVRLGVIDVLPFLHLSPALAVAPSRASGCRVSHKRQPLSAGPFPTTGYFPCLFFPSKRRSRSRRDLAWLPRVARCVPMPVSPRRTAFVIFFFYLLFFSGTVFYSGTC
ncbi:hypothetical protein GGR52DRAFT_440800 [Hypoxylon sp. FL1284]|nr:hypothetical protein GGR52DRAFT_440800 [Hypoxylon sp. FL1284]